MPLTLVEVGTSAGIGVLDIGLEELDKKQAYTKSFQNTTDWGRVIVTGGGYLANFSKMGPEEVTKSAVLSGLPLLCKSVYRGIRTYVIKGKKLGRKRIGLKLVKKGQKGSGGVRWG